MCEHDPVVGSEHEHTGVGSSGEDVTDGVSGNVRQRSKRLGHEVLTDDSRNLKQRDRRLGQASETTFDDRSDAGRHDSGRDVGPPAQGEQRCVLLDEQRVAVAVRRDRRHDGRADRRPDHGAQELADCVDPKWRMWSSVASASGASSSGR